MTVSSTSPKIQYDCNGSTTDFTFTFNASATDEISVILTTSAGVETTLTENSHYFVTATNNDYTAGGTVSTCVTGDITTPYAWASGYTLTIMRVVDITQETDLVPQPTLYQTLEDALDKCARIDQQLQEQLDRTPKLKESSAVTDITFPEPEANKIIGWNAGATDLTTFTATATNINLTTIYQIADYSDDLDAAITDIGSNEATLLINETADVNDDVTVPTNVHLWIVRPGSFSVDSTKTLTIYSPANVIAPSNMTIFTGDGTTVFSKGGDIHVGWFGAKPDSTGAAGNGTDNLAYFDDAFASISDTQGSRLLLQPGIYRVSDYWAICNSSLSSSFDVTIEGAGRQQNSSIYLDNDSGTYLLYYSGTSKHTITLKNLFLYNTTAGLAEGVTFNPATAISIDETRFHLENVWAVGFTTGLAADNAYSSRILNCKIKQNQYGVTLTGTNVHMKVQGNDFSDNGTYTSPYTDGWGFKAYYFGGIFEQNTVESMLSRGLWLTAAHGVDILCNNFETFTNSRSIYITGKESGNFADIRDWSEGINIIGNRFWNALGIHFADGVGWVNIDGNGWTNNEPEASQLQGAETYCVHVSATNLNYFRQINYTSRNHWLHNVMPMLHATSGYSHAFKLDGQAWRNAEPITGTFEVGDKVLKTGEVENSWTCETAGTGGTLNTGATTGTVVVATDDQRITVNSLTGIFPGAKITIAGAGAAGANLDVTVGGVDTTNKVISFYPTASTSVTDAAISYTAFDFIP